MDDVPLLEIFTVVCMVIVAYAHSREGFFGAAIMFFNVLLAGFLTFNFWEVAVSSLHFTPGGVLERYSDAVFLAFFYAVILGILRLITQNVVPGDIAQNALFRQIGGAVVGLITGYIVSGILICMFMTLPWHENFLWYKPETGVGLGGPEKVWLAMMHKASGQVFDYGTASWFDADGSFIPRYQRYRRYTDKRDEPMKNQGDFPAVLPTQKRE